MLASFGLTGENPSERNVAGPGLGQLGVQVASNFFPLELAIWLQWMSSERGSIPFIHGNPSAYRRAMKLQFDMDK